MNIKEDAKKTVIVYDSEEEEEEEEEEKEEKEIINYSNSECPICMEEYNDINLLKYASCGHCLCIDCYKNIMNLNKKCYCCRAEWKKPVLLFDNYTEFYKDYTISDIQNLINEEDINTLYDIIDLKDVSDHLIETTGAEWFFQVDYFRYENGYSFLIRD
jgi:hypothetical protein